MNFFLTRHMLGYNDIQRRKRTDPAVYMPSIIGAVMFAVGLAVGYWIAG